MSQLVHTRIGSGPPLLLVHGIGSHQEAWAPVVPLLTPHREVITVDLPGFGRSPMRRGQDVTPTGLAMSVVDFCAELGISRPHVAGNSLGGWIALELARLGHAASVTGLSPAGLWRSCPRRSRAQIRALHDLPVALGPLAPRIARILPLRVALTANVYGRPWKLSGDEMADEVRTVATCTGFRPVLEATEHMRFVGGMRITVPVTIAFGSRDVLLGRGCRVAEELPAQTNWLPDPRGWGHLPMWDDPRGVADLLLEGSSVGVTGLSAVS